MLLLACLLSRGTSGGDEGQAISLAAMASERSWGALFKGADGAWAAHRLLWVAEKFVEDWFWHAVLPARFYNVSIFHSGLMVLDGSLFMLASVIVAVGHLLEKGFRWAVAILSTAALFFASSAVSFFAGGVIECQMILYVTVIAALLDQDRPISGSQFALLVAASALLIFCKFYSLMFVLPVSLLLSRARDRCTYLFVILILTGAWFTVISILGQKVGSMGTFYTNMIVVKNISEMLTGMAAAFISWPFGLLWCFPLIFLAICARDWRSLIIKSVAIFPMAALFPLFQYWYGAGAVAGPRYPAPFLFILLPEVARGLSMLIGHYRRVAFIIPVLAIFFLPSIEYRNSLVMRWMSLPDDAAQLPNSDPGLHPAVLAWRVVVAKTDGAREFRPSPMLPYVIPTTQIFPMTAVSRVIYVTEHSTDLSDTRWCANFELVCCAPD